MWLQLVIVNSQFVDSEEQDVIQIDLLKDLERVIYSGGSSSMWLCALLVVALVVSAVVVWRRQRIRAWESLTGDELETGLGLTPCAE